MPFCHVTIWHHVMVIQQKPSDPIPPHLASIFSKLCQKDRTRCIIQQGWQIISLSKSQSHLINRSGGVCQKAILALLSSQVVLQVQPSNLGVQLIQLHKSTWRSPLGETESAKVHSYLPWDCLSLPHGHHQVRNSTHRELWSVRSVHWTSSDSSYVTNLDNDTSDFWTQILIL